MTTAVSVHGLRNGGVAEHLLNDLRIDVLYEERGARMAQAMEGETLFLVLRPKSRPFQ